LLDIGCSDCILVVEILFDTIEFIECTERFETLPDSGIESLDGSLVVSVWVGVEDE